MARLPRFPVTDLPLHVVQRGNDRSACFFEDRDRVVYLRALREAAVRYDVLVHAYVLMTNHVHLLVTPQVMGAVSRMMQSVGARYVWHVNHTRERTGTLWEGRYKACVVERDRHVLAVCRYIDLNPVRAGMVMHPANYRWSSYAELAGLRRAAWIVPHPSLEQLGVVPGPAYAKWCDLGISAAEAAELREATLREMAFGDTAFKQAIERATSRRTTPIRRSPLLRHSLAGNYRSDP